MTVLLKTPEEIKIMQEGGAILHRVMQDLLKIVRPGITTNSLDQAARAKIKEYGADASFDKVKGYRWAICTSVNEQIVHTPPSDYILQEGDVLTIDAGVYYKGYHTDHAKTVIVGENSDPAVEKFLKVGETALAKAIDKVREGARLGEISACVQKEIEDAGYEVVKQLTGHGIGRELHEEPHVPNFLSQPIEQTLQMMPGLVIAIEPIYAMGSGEMVYEEGDSRSIATKDGSLSAQFEHTVALTDKNRIILT